MSLDLKSIKKLIKLMRSEGVLNLKTSEIELSLSQDHLEQAPSGVPILELDTATAPQSPTFTEEQILMWSAPGLEFPEESH